MGVKSTQVLTPREVECLYWIAQGKTTKDVAVVLGISYETVRWYLKSAKSKLDCCTLAQAVCKTWVGRMGVK